MSSPYKVSLAVTGAHEPETHAEFEQITASLQTQLTRILADLTNPERARVFLAANQSIPDSTDTTVLWTTARPTTASQGAMEEYDSHSLYDSTSGSMRITTPGLYRVSAQTVWTGNATGSRTLAFYTLEGTFSATARQAGNATTNYVQHAVPLNITSDVLNAYNGQVRVAVQVTQSSGGALSVLSAASWFALTRIGKVN